MAVHRLTRCTRRGSPASLFAYNTIGLSPPRELEHAILFICPLPSDLDHTYTRDWPSTRPPLCPSKSFGILCP
ncbi:hypothetical protein ACET3X_004127 [Alternaria dauci]|uniref:Uncharacterized protein n=1 Tax=Alternaria dauci TaxID=48095 RepID=A0ABR3ULZ8_9PLEO